MAQMTKEELLEKLFHDDYEHLKGKKLRMTRMRVPGKEVCLAHVICPSQACIYQNLGMNIGVHEGEDHTGESIGMIRFTPWESVVVAADIAIKSADIQITFMDRFCGSDWPRYRLQLRQSSDFLGKSLALKPVQFIKVKG